MANKLSNHFFYQLGKKQIDLSADSIKVILMATGFTFNEDNHATYSDVSASELVAGYGYLQNNKTLSGATFTEDDANNQAILSSTAPSWTASGGSIGPSPGAILYDDTTSDDTIIGYVDFGTDKTATDGTFFSISPLTIALK